MRLLPLLTALIVAAVLYAVIIERDRLVQFARDASPRAGETAPAGPSGAPDAPGAEAAEAEADGSDGEGAIRVMATRSQAREVDSAVTLRGETEAIRQVDVRSETSGKVVSTPLRSGTFTEAGDTLCRIDPGTREAALAEARARLAEAEARRPEIDARIPEAEARVAEARARLEEARINANAATRLSADGFASQTRVAATEAALRSAEAAVSTAQAGLEAARGGLESLKAGIESAAAAVARAETEIDRLTIVAPFPGLLETDTAELGSLLQPGSLCATVIQLDPMKLVGFVPETEIGRISVGARAGGRLTDGGEVAGDVTFLSRSADPVTRTFRVEITVPNPDLALRDGQTVELAIEAEGVTAHLLPQSALTLNDDGALGLRVVDEGGRAKFHEVTLLRDTRQGVWLGGLPDRVDVITVGQEYVTDGVAVAPSFEEVLQ